MEGKPCRNFFSTDGEDIIISNGYSDIIRDAMRSHLIDWGRVGASMTAIANSCDRAHTFRDTKRQSRIIRRNQIDISNEVLQRSMREAFAGLKAAYPSINVTSGFIANIIEGTEVLVHAYKHAMTPAEIRRSFKCCGQHCEPIPDKGNITVDFTNLMAQCYTNFTSEEMTHMEAQTIPLALKIQSHGTVTWKDMDEAGIPKHVNSIDRTNLTHIRHWSEIINHPDVVARYDEEQLRKSPAEVQRKKDENEASKRQAQAVKLARSLLSKEAKAAQTKAKKAEERQTEKIRFAALSPAEQAREKKEKSDIRNSKNAAKRATILAATQLVEANAMLVEDNKVDVDEDEEDVEADIDENNDDDDVI